MVGSRKSRVLGLKVYQVDAFEDDSRGSESPSSGSMALKVDRGRKVTSGGASWVTTGVSTNLYWARPMCQWR